MKKILISLAVLALSANAFAHGVSLNATFLKAGPQDGLQVYGISWQAPLSKNTVLTVELVGEGPEKVMACEAAAGNATAEWIQPGRTYIFKVYESSQCTAQVAKFGPASATFVLTHAQESGSGESLPFVDLQVNGQK
jgi:hypothetical protein